MHNDLPTPASTHPAIGGSNGTAHGATTQAQTSRLISPYGGSLVNLLVPPEAHHEVKSYASQLPSIQLSERAVCDLQLLATGAFSPLDRFMGQEDYQRVVHDMRLTSGHLFPIPVTLPVEPGPALRLDRDIALRDARSNLLAVMTIHDICAWDYPEWLAKFLAPWTCVILSWPRCAAGAPCTFPGNYESCSSRHTMISGLYALRPGRRACAWRHLDSRT